MSYVRPCSAITVSLVVSLVLLQGGSGRDSNHYMLSSSAAVPTSSQFRQTLAELASHSRLTGSIDLDDRLTGSSLRDPAGDPDTPADDRDDPLPSGISTKEQLGRINFSVSYDFDSQTLTVKIIRAERLAAKDLSGTSDPYVKISLLPDKKHTLTTNVKRKNLNPRWNEIFAFEGYHVAGPTICPIIIIIIIIITKAKIIVTLSRKKSCRGTLQSSKCDVDAP